MKNYQKRYINSIGAILFLLVIYLGISYFIYKSEEEVSKNWKTYRNEEYGFEFKYPEDWAPPKLSTSNDTTKGVFTKGNFDKYGGFTFEMGAHYDLTKNRNLSIQEVIDSTKIDGSGTFSQENIVIGNKSGVKVERIEEFEGTNTYYYIYVSLDSEGNILKIFGAKGFISMKTFNKIINTFKFTN